MATYLTLCQDVARESGVVSGTQPASVESQVGTLNKIVEWVKHAWIDIQNSRSAWLWMVAEFEADTIASTQRYTAASFSLTRFAEWKTPDGGMTLYLKSTGVSDEREIVKLSWYDFKRQYLRGSQTNNRPITYTVSPANELCFGPIPDAIYTARGEYRKSPQIFAAADDIPELPERFHQIIKWRALQMLAEHDEATFQVGASAARYREMFSDLCRDQLPRMTLPGSLA